MNKDVIIEGIKEEEALKNIRKKIKMNINLSKYGSLLLGLSFYGVSYSVLSSFGIGAVYTGAFPLIIASMGIVFGVRMYYKNKADDLNKTYRVMSMAYGKDELTTDALVNGRSKGKNNGMDQENKLSNDRFQYGFRKGSCGDRRGGDERSSRHTR